MIKVSGDDAIFAIAKRLETCGDDEFADILENMFGGTCYPIGFMDDEEFFFEFYPNEKYRGELGEDDGEVEEHET